MIEKILMISSQISLIIAIISMLLAIISDLKDNNKLYYKLAPISFFFILLGMILAAIGGLIDVCRHLLIF